MVNVLDVIMICMDMRTRLAVALITLLVWSLTLCIIPAVFDLEA